MNQRANTFTRRMTLFLLTAVAGVTVSCASESSEMSLEQTMGPEGLTISEVRAKVMSFSDSYAMLVAQATNEFKREVETPQARRLAHAEKVATVLSAYTIASQDNPLAALLDMVVLAELSRESFERYWEQSPYQEQAQVVVEAYRQGEQEIWRIARRVLDPQEIDELHRLIDDWRADHPNQYSVSHIRFANFSAHRRKVGSAKKKGGGSLFGLFMLDPLANLDPATREIEQARLLAERVVFLLSRAPVVVGWQAEEVYYEIAAAPEVEQLVAAADTVSGAMESFAVSGEQLVAAVQQAPDKLSERVAVERDAAIRQIQDVIASEREAILGGLDERQETLSGTLGEVREIVDASRELAETVQMTLASADTLASRFEPVEPSTSDPVEIKDIQATIVDTTAAAREFNDLVQSVDRLLASPQFGELETAVALAEAGMNRLMTRFFLLIGGIVVLIFAGSTMRLWVKRRMPAAGGKSAATAEPR